ncbi:hypothetical protein CTAYLR_005444 [Chrysophaeum taylorii]|uniref:Sperm-associated antigen 16 protein n=1 Tax=Chrysophaeum taylorii TaxID=2483200 RepID=A0AAD7UJM4_9STRA|nr:hypothetical protein CTAYLR_005444 [Chrysophaeum taylorii]
MDDDDGKDDDVVEKPNDDEEEEEEEEEFNYEGVDETEDMGVEDEDDLAAALVSSSSSVMQPAQSPPQVLTQVRPEVVDDFIRNFLIKVGMTRTLASFNSEWYELRAKGKLAEEHTTTVPDIYLRNQELDEKVSSLQQQVDKMREITAKARGTWDKFRKERDFHRMHHRRVVQEKNKLTTDLQRLRKHYLSYEPTLKDLQRKYEVAMKEKMLTRLERDRIKARVHTLEAQLKQLHDERAEKQHPGAASKPRAPKKGADSRLPSGPVANPFASLAFDPPPVDRFQLRRTFRAHLNSVSAAAFHPTKPILATVSDDMTWKLWSVPNCDLVMSGEGHKDWVAGVDFHPAGTHLATSSGDKTVKVWDFAGASCATTFADHAQAVWDCAFHHTGDFLASCSMDHTTRLWDLSSLRCRQTLRGHVDSVNSVCWQPYSNHVCTASGDKTVSIWDARTGLCVQTFYGHTNACNAVAVNNRGDVLASCDADGAIKLWDVRTVTEIGTIQVSQHPCNRVCFDRSATRIIAASDDGFLRGYATDDLSAAETWLGRGHEDAVQCVAFDPADALLISTSTDCTFRIWS